MLRSVPLVSISIGVLLVTIGSTQAAQYGTAEEAMWPLRSQVPPSSQLYFSKTLCRAFITAHPTRKGGQLKNFPLGQQVMRTATVGKVSEVTYSWPRPGSVKPLEKHTFYTKVGDQICGVGYYQ